MSPKISPASLALIGLAILAVSAIWRPTALSGREPDFSPAPGDRGLVSAVLDTDSDQPMWLLAASNIVCHGTCHPICYTKSPQPRELTFSETDEVFIHWRIRNSGLNKTDFELPGTAMMARPAFEPGYCPDWYQPRPLRRPGYDTSPVLFSLTVMMVRYTGEIINSYSSNNHNDLRAGRIDAINWICAKFSGLERGWLLKVLADTQKDDLLPPEVWSREAAPPLRWYYLLLSKSLYSHKWHEETDDDAVVDFRDLKLVF